MAVTRSAAAKHKAAAAAKRAANPRRKSTIGTRTYWSKNKCWSRRADSGAHYTVCTGSKGQKGVYKKKGRKTRKGKGRKGSRRQRVEMLERNTTLAGKDIEAIRKRLNSVKERTTILEKAERKRHRQERQRLKELERLKELGAMLGHGTDLRKTIADFRTQLRKEEEEAKRNAGGAEAS